MIVTHNNQSVRVTRAMAALRFTGERTTNAWLARLCKTKFKEAASAQKLDSCGYRVRFDRTDPRRGMY